MIACEQDKIVPYICFISDLCYFLSLLATKPCTAEILQFLVYCFHYLNAIIISFSNRELLN